ncbi:hypothetical protein IWQ56_001502, partial [Coemansia nantahalensis]
MRGKRVPREEPEDEVFSFGADTTDGPQTKDRRRRVSDVDDIVDALLGGELEGACRPRKRPRKKKAAAKPKATTPMATIKPALPDVSSSNSEVEDSIVDLYAWESSDGEGDNRSAKPAEPAMPIEPVVPAEPADAQERQAERQRAMRLAMAAAAGSETGGSDMPRNED